MASRKDEKEARRAERIAAEEAERKKQANQQRLLIGGGLLAAIAAIAVVAVLVLGGGDDSAGDGTETPNTSVPIPARQISDLADAAKKAGCDFKTFPSEGRGHLGSDTATNPGYKTNPPTSGDHRPKWAEDGIYATGNEPDAENWVHSLEHGRILYQYAPGTPQKRIDQLQTLFAEPFKGTTAGYHQMVLQNNTEMPFAVAAVAWTHYVGCKEFTDDTFDVLRAFRDRFVDKGPELVQ